MKTHPGEVYAQRRAGFAREGLGSAGMGVRLPDAARRFLAEQRMLILGGTDGDGAVWAGAAYGPPGFVRASGAETVLVDWTPAVGDPLRTVLREGRPVGAIAIEPATRRRMRVNGTIAAEGPPLAVRADQVFANCPKYIIERHAHELVARPPAVRATQRLTDGQRRRITAADTFFIATAAEGHGVDVSHRGGEPGFVEIADDGTVSWPDYRGNAMFMTLGNLHLSPRCGLLFLAWSGAEPSLHITGRARVDWDVGRAAAHPGAERMIDFQVESVYELTGSTLIWQ